MTTPGWYADPLGRAELRWYRGNGWGDQVRTGAVEGQDPIDLTGNPLWSEPRWTTAAPPTGAGSVPPTSAERAGIGRGTVVAIVVVVVVTVGLLAAAAVAVLVLVRNVPTLTGEQIEAQVAAELSRRLGTPVRVDCPSVAYAGSADGTLECTATGASLDAPLRVEVVVRDAAVRRWEVLETFEPGAPA